MRATKRRREDLLRLLDEVMAISHHVRVLADELVEDLPRPHREILLSVVGSNRLTVPQLARQRSSSRQRVQAVVDSLRRRNLVELARNPRHKRSKFVVATAKGQALADEARRALAVVANDALTTRPWPIKRSFKAAADTLHDVRALFENEYWRRNLAERMRKILGHRTDP
jgi:DNA-binding MarR family transcriptional regulator